jgi:hypothetical protein
MRSFQFKRSKNKVILAVGIICTMEEIHGLQHGYPWFYSAPTRVGWFIDKLDLLCKYIIRSLFKNARPNLVRFNNMSGG